MNKLLKSFRFDRTLGGNAFSLRLAHHLAKLFKEKTKKDVFTNPKAIVKLYKEADRVKNILSANTDTMSQVEGLMDDVDFKVGFLILLILEFFFFFELKLNFF